MKRLFGIGMMLALAPTGYGQSAKNAVQVSSATLIQETADQGWTTILGDEDGPFDTDSVRIHTSQQKDLVFGASFECGLYTQTQVKSRGGNKETADARALVQVRVVVDPGTGQERVAYPGPVTYCDRYQELSAALQGILDIACAEDEDGNFDCDLEVIDDEEVELVQRTLNANAFFFALDDLGAGTHNVVVQARIETDTGTTNAGSSANATALVGQGALTVEEVRLLKDTNIDINP